jgi:steroid delta-isomerase-like uncharacterized protein
MSLRESHQRHVDQAWNAGRDVIGELFAVDHVYHDPVLGDLPEGPEGIRTAIASFLEGMPDAALRIDEWIEDETCLIARWTLTGTNTGELWGMAPSGRATSMTGMHVFRFERDRITETWVSYDALGLLDRLGLVTLGIALGGSALPLG